MLGNAEAITYGLSSAQIIILAWMVFELRAVKDGLKEQASRVRRVELVLGSEKLRGID